jgi:hypothetical protein
MDIFCHPDRGLWRETPRGRHVHHHSTPDEHFVVHDHSTHRTDDLNVDSPAHLDHNGRAEPHHRRHPPGPWVRLERGRP